MNPKSKYVRKYQPVGLRDDFMDDSIVKINTDGKILYEKSVTEILIENKIVPEKNFILIIELPLKAIKKSMIRGNVSTNWNQNFLGPILI